MSPKKSRRQQALRCHRCQSRNVTVSGVQQMLVVAGKKVLHARCTCINGHEWWSKTLEALKLSREVDANRVNAAGGAHLGT